ncbi:MAG: hypothetical protein WD768_16250 [Phycisphaeraceae bacterium]
MRPCLAFLMVMLLLVLAGCDVSQEEMGRRTRARAVRLCNAIQRYHDRQLRYPKTLEDLKPYFKSDEEFKIAMSHPRTGAMPAWEFVRPGESIFDVEKPKATPMLYEIIGGKRVAGGYIGYVDTHVEPELTPALTEEELALPE